MGLLLKIKTAGDKLCMLLRVHPTTDNGFLLSPLQSLPSEVKNIDIEDHQRYKGFQASTSSANRRRSQAVL